MNTTRDDFDPIPSTRHRVPVGVGSLKQAEEAADALAVPVALGKEPPDELGADAAGLASAGFTGERGQTLVRTREDGPVRVAVGTGAPERIDATLARDLAAEFGSGGGRRAHRSATLHPINRARLSSSSD